MLFKMKDWDPTNSLVMKDPTFTFEDENDDDFDDESEEDEEEYEM